jgi:hypothetical protein
MASRTTSVRPLGCSRSIADGPYSTKTWLPSAGMSLGALMRLTLTICSSVCGGLFFQKQPVGRPIETHLRTM